EEQIESLSVDPTVETRLSARVDAYAHLLDRVRRAVESYDPWSEFVDFRPVLEPLVRELETALAAARSAVAGDWPAAPRSVELSTAVAGRTIALDELVLSKVVDPAQAEATRMIEAVQGGISIVVRTHDESGEADSPSDGRASL